VYLILSKPEDDTCAKGKSKRERKRGEKKEGRREKLVLSQSGGNTALITFPSIASENTVVGHFNHKKGSF
jgi:hypothetical protein